MQISGRLSSTAPSSNKYFQNCDTSGNVGIIIFDVCHLFRKKAGLQGFIKKLIIPEPLEINNCFF
jgi:hypothetical protein